MSRSIDHIGNYSVIAPRTQDPHAHDDDSERPNAIKLTDVMVSSIVAECEHAGLLDSLGAPPAQWDLRQSDVE